MRRTTRFGGGDILENRDQTCDVNIKRLKLSQPQSPSRHTLPGGVIGHVVKRCDQFLTRAGRREHIPVLAIVHELAGPVLSGRDYRQAARERFQDNQRTGVVKSGLHEEVGGPVARLHVGIETQEVDRLVQAQPARQTTKRPRLTAAADHQMNGPGLAIPLPPRRECLQERSQALEREIVSDKKPCQITRLQSYAVSECTPDRPRL